MIEAIAMIAASLGVFQALLLIGHLLTLDRGNRLAHRLFALMLLGLSIRVAKSVFNYYLVLDPWVRNLGLAGLLLVGPSFWLYGKVITQRLAQIKPIDVLQFAPAVFYGFFCWLIPNQKTWASYASYVFIMSHWAIYLCLSIKTTKQINETLAREAGAWHRQVLIGLWVLWCYYSLVFVGIVPYYLGGAVVYSLLIAGLTILFLNLSHFSATKYLQTKQSSEQSRSTMTVIEIAMSEDKPYLDSKLTVSKLAQSLDLSPRQVSRAINEFSGLGFAAFVKQYRLDHAKKLLADPSYGKAKISSIAQESGFGNVASFNSAFLAQENVTPSEFRDQTNKTQ